MRVMTWRTCAGGKSAAGASAAPAAAGTLGVRLDAGLQPPDADADGATPSAGDAAFLAEVRGGAEVED